MVVKLRVNRSHWRSLEMYTAENGGYDILLVYCSISSRTVNDIAASLFSDLYDLYLLRTATFQMLVVALVHLLLDYGNAVVGIPTYLVRRLQSVLNAAERLIYHLRPHDHITDALATVTLDTTLAARSRTRAVQDRSANVQSSARQRATISGTSCRRRWPTWSACSVVSKYQPPGHTAHQTVCCWQPCLSGCCSSSLERSARGLHLIVITADFPASVKDLSFSTFVSTPDSLTLSGIVTVVFVVTLLFRPL